MKHTTARRSLTVVAATAVAATAAAAGAAAAGAALALAAGFAWASPAVSAVPSRIVASIDVSDTVALAGNTHPWATPAADQGLVPGEQPLNSMFIALRRSPTQERALAAFMARQLDVASPDYHHWLQPQEFGLRYGPNDADISAVTGWLKAAGLQVHGVSAGRLSIEFSGTAAQVQEAFGVEMHRYVVKGESAIANDRDPRIPRALSPVVADVSGLNTFSLNGHTAPGRVATAPGPVALNAAPAGSATTAAIDASPALKTSGIGATPQLSLQDDSYSFAYMTPYDFATIYNSLPLWNASKPITGSGVTIAIVGDNDVKLDDIKTFQSTFGLPVNAPTLQLVGSDPAGSSEESTVTLEMASAAAPGASLILVVPDGSLTVASALSSVKYTVDQNQAAIVVFPYVVCERLLGTSNNTINQYWQQGVTQGMSIVVAAGDFGSAGCNDSGGPVSSGGLEVNGFASSPWVTAVGGTDFAWQWGANSFSTYWNSNATSTGHYASAKGYIPEVPWNVTCTNALLLQGQDYLVFDTTDGHLPDYTTNQNLCSANYNNSYYKPLLQSIAGGGGASTCTSLDSSGNCQSGYMKPDWQKGTGVPADGKRDLPDVSLFASGGWLDVQQYGVKFNPPTPIIPSTEILVCYSGGSSPHACTYDTYADVAYQTYGGTGAAAAYWAGILALVVQQQGGERQGLVNPKLYNLSSAENLSACNTSVVAAGNTCVFYDVSAGVTNGVACVPGSSTDCYVIPDSTTEYETTYGILDGYTAGVGYDQTTGLGSVNITNLVNKWSTATATPPTPASSVAMGALVDYLGDGRSDFSVWRPTTGYFYSANQQGTSSAKQWGAATDIPLTGDFDGDQVTDFAVWRPSTGYWYIVQSSTGTVVSKQWGAATDIPVTAGDFDGDGKTDIAVWRPSTGYWYIVQSSTGTVVSKQWGAATDIPITGDFDGDGKTDIAVWRPSTGFWYIVQSSNGQIVAKQWGAATDVPVIGDFDGDGKTDIAVYRPSTGYWYVIQSSNGQVAATQWGASGDVPVPSDYNGAGKTNIAVWRPSTGTWYVYEGGSQQALTKSWGASTDVPLEQQSKH